MATNLVQNITTEETLPIKNQTAAAEEGTDEKRNFIRKRVMKWKLVKSAKCNGKKQVLFCVPNSSCLPATDRFFRCELKNWVGFFHWIQETRTEHSMGTSWRRTVTSHCKLMNFISNSDGCEDYDNATDDDEYNSGDVMKRNGTFVPIPAVWFRGRNQLNDFPVDDTLRTDGKRQEKWSFTGIDWIW